MCLYCLLYTSVDAVRDNPYIIASGDFGAEFYLADTLALELGFEADCPQRIEAAVIFELTHNLTNGHTFLPYEKLLAATSQLIEVETEPVSEAVEVLCDLGLVAREKVAGQDACYLAEIHYAEEYKMCIRDRASDQICLFRRGEGSNLRGDARRGRQGQSRYLQKQGSR